MKIQRLIQIETLPEYVKIDKDENEIIIRKKVSSIDYIKRISIRKIEIIIKEIQESYNYANRNQSIESINSITVNFNNQIQEFIEKIELAIEESNKPENKYINKEGLINGIKPNIEEGTVYIRLSLTKGVKKKNRKLSINTHSINDALKELVKTFCEFHEIELTPELKKLFLSTELKYKEFIDNM